MSGETQRDLATQVDVQKTPERTKEYTVAEMRSILDRMPVEQKRALMWESGGLVAPEVPSVDEDGNLYHPLTEEYRPAMKQLYRKTIEDPEMSTLWEENIVGVNGPRKIGKMSDPTPKLTPVDGKSEV